MAELATADAARRLAVGHGLNLMSTAFVERFGTFFSFQALPRPEQTEYLRSLVSGADGLASKDPEVALGFRLYGMVVAALIENDRESMSEIDNQLASNSREGDLGL